MSKRRGQIEGSGRKKLDVCKSKRIRISEDLFQRWKDLKRIRKARSDEELVAYLLDLATATNLSDLPRYGKRCTTVDRHTVASVQGVNYYAYNFRGIAPLTFQSYQRTSCTRDVTALPTSSGVAQLELGNGATQLHYV